MDLPKKGARQIRGLGNIIAHRVELQGECLLVMGGDSEYSPALTIPSGQKPLRERPVENLDFVGFCCSSDAWP